MTEPLSDNQVEKIRNLCGENDEDEHKQEMNESNNPTPDAPSDVAREAVVSPEARKVAQDIADWIAGPILWNEWEINDMAVAIQSAITRALSAQSARIAELDRLRAVAVAEKESLNRESHELTQQLSAQGANVATPFIDAILNDAQGISVRWRFDEQQADSIHGAGLTRFVEEISAIQKQFEAQSAELKRIRKDRDELAGCNSRQASGYEEIDTALGGTQDKTVEGLCRAATALRQQLATVTEQFSRCSKCTDILIQERDSARAEVERLKEEHEAMGQLRVVLKDEWQEGDDGEADVVVRILNQRDNLRQKWSEITDYGRNPADENIAWFLKAKEIQIERDTLRAALTAAKEAQP